MHTVMWGDDALVELARLWSEAEHSLQPAITAAVHEIDRRLGEDPVNVGESRHGANRVCFEFPLGVLFKVDSAKKVVHVVEVWTFQKRR